MVIIRYVHNNTIVYEIDDGVNRAGKNGREEINGKVSGVEFSYQFIIGVV
jgi:hypothetical protein